MRLHQNNYGAVHYSIASISYVCLSFMHVCMHVCIDSLVKYIRCKDDSIVLGYLIEDYVEDLFCPRIFEKDIPKFFLLCPHDI
jgi:hypothetical protein